MADSATKTAAILLIGDEILSGKIEDTNARYAVRELRALGVSLRRVLVVPDVVEDIASTVRDLSERFDFVITSGGVGPTHDDLTMESVAKAFGTKLVRNAHLERLMCDYWGDKLHEANLRMADIPEGAELLSSDHASWPVTTLRNVYILPGLPEIFRRKFDAIKARFKQDPFHLRCVFTSSDEATIALLLRQVTDDYAGVQIGSYPRLTGDYRVKVTLESKNEALVTRAFDELVSNLPPGTVVRTE